MISMLTMSVLHALEDFLAVVGADSHVEFWGLFSDFQVAQIHTFGRDALPSTTRRVIDAV